MIPRNRPAPRGSPRLAPPFRRAPARPVRLCGAGRLRPGRSIALASLIYPTAIRSTGFGWAMAVGRFGRVLAPLISGAAASARVTGGQTFLMFGLAPVVGALALLALRDRQAAATLLTTLDDRAG